MATKAKLAKNIDIPTAFLRGARAIQPQRGYYYIQSDPTRPPVGCAVGALAYGVGQVNGDGDVDKVALRATYPVLRTPVRECPADRQCNAGASRYGVPGKGGVMYADILCVMEHLFETHGWTFEAIGAWLSKYSVHAAKIVALQGELDALLAGKPAKRRRTP